VKATVAEVVIRHAVPNPGKGRLTGGVVRTGNLRKVIIR
jgi:hypothetical protein